MIVTAQCETSLAVVCHNVCAFNVCPLVVLGHRRMLLVALACRQGLCLVPAPEVMSAQANRPVSLRACDCTVGAER